MKPIYRPATHKSSITTLPIVKYSLYFLEGFIYELSKIRRCSAEEFTCCIFCCVEG